jgi:hypothetical protein
MLLMGGDVNACFSRKDLGRIRIYLLLVTRDLVASGTSAASLLAALFSDSIMTGENVWFTGLTLSLGLDLFVQCSLLSSGPLE